MGRRPHDLSPLPGSIRVEMQGPPPHYGPAKLAASAGDPVFYLDNVSQGTHTLTIGPLSAMERPILKIGSYFAASEPVGAGRSAAFMVRGLRAGKYAIWCTIGPHAEEGMVGTLTVK